MSVMVSIAVIHHALRDESFRSKDRTIRNFRIVASKIATCKCRLQVRKKVGIR
jgi:hypothetical protein